MISKNRIIENAIELFRQKGCKSITMDDISVQNGISKRTLYELFKDKSSLLEECLVYHSEKKREITFKLKEESSNILEYILSFQDYESRESDRTSYLFTEEIKRFYPKVYENTIVRVKQEQLAYTQSLIEEGIREGLFDEGVGLVNVKAQILTLLVGLNSYAISEHIKNDSDRLEIFLSSVVVFLKGLSTPKGREIINDYLKKKNIISNN